MIAVLSATHTGSPCTVTSLNARPFLRWQPPAVDTVHPSCVSPKRIVLHAQAAPRERADRRQPEPFHPASCGYFPVLVILPVLHDRQIDRTELIAYRFKVRPIPAVAAVINLLLRGNEQKTGPQRLVTLQPTAGKVPRRQHVDGELVAGRYRLLPVRFINQRPSIPQ